MLPDPSIPTHVAAFLAEHVDSVVQLEALLLLHGEPDRAWSATEAGKELRVDPAWVSGQMEYLGSRGLVARVEGPEPRYRFAAQNPDLSRAVADLAKIYSQRRVTVISLIYSRPVDPVRHLADAFRFRKPTQEQPPHG